MADTATAPAAPKKPAYDFRIAGNNVDRVDIGGRFHIAGSGFGEVAGSVKVNGVEAQNIDEWNDENITGHLPVGARSGEVLVTTSDKKVLKGYLKLLDRNVEGDPRADKTDDGAPSNMTSAGH